MGKNNHKIFMIARLICSAVVIAFALLQLFGLWDKANFVAVPLLGVTLLLQTIHEWKTNRKSAIFGLVAAIFVISCSVAMIFI